MLLKSQHPSHALTGIEKDHGEKLDEATSNILSKAGAITVLLHRIKNIKWPRRARNATAEKANIPHGVSGFNTVPEKCMQKLGLSHHNGYVYPYETHNNLLKIYRVSDPPTEEGWK
jgi:hypothetical protein